MEDDKNISSNNEASDDGILPLSFSSEKASHLVADDLNIQRASASKPERVIFAEYCLNSIDLEIKALLMRERSVPQSLKVKFVFKSPKRGFVDSKTHWLTVSQLCLLKALVDQTFARYCDQFHVSRTADELALLQTSFGKNLYSQPEDPVGDPE